MVILSLDLQKYTPGQWFFVDRSAEVYAKPMGLLRLSINLTRYALRQLGFCWQTWICNAATVGHLSIDLPRFALIGQCVFVVRSTIFAQPLNLLQWSAHCTGDAQALHRRCTGDAQAHLKFSIFATRFLGNTNIETGWARIGDFWRKP